MSEVEARSAAVKEVQAAISATSSVWDDYQDIASALFLFRLIFRGSVVFLFFVRLLDQRFLILVWLMVIFINFFLLFPLVYANVHFNVRDLPLKAGHIRFAPFQTPSFICTIVDLQDKIVDVNFESVTSHDVIASFLSLPTDLAYPRFTGYVNSLK